MNGKQPEEYLYVLVMDSETNLSALLAAINHDPALTDKDKATLSAKLHDPTFFRQMMYGGVGVGTADAISNWIKLSKKARILLAIAGFGIGQLILHAVSSEDKPLKFNKATKTYEVS